jgi:acetylornithine/N-succinyldiaminopimelate aminotransferase
VIDPQGGNTYKKLQGRPSWRHFFLGSVMTSSVLPTYKRAPLAFDHGKGMRLYTEDGKEYLDFGAGVAVTSLGHAHPHLVKALTDQAQKVWHTSNVYQIPGQEKLAKRLTEATFAEVVFFTNSGAEALECSIKMARKYHSAKGNPERYRIITFEGAFHGRTLATIAAGGQAKYIEGFGPKVDGFDQVPFGDEKALLAAITEATAGILIEPLQGEGGVRPVPPKMLKRLRDICDEHGLLLLLDEVQCGVGRTGKLFAHEWAGVTPDIMAVAKGIGGGFPVGACLATKDAAQGMTAGTHGSTFGGNPLAMAVGNAVLDIILADGFLDRVRQRGINFKQKLAGLKDSHPDIIEDIRGDGLMMGIKTKVPNTDFVAHAIDEQLLTIGAGDNVVRLLPPLIVSDDDLSEAVAKLERTCQSFKAKSA